VNFSRRHASLTILGLGVLVMAVVNSPQAARISRAASPGVEQQSGDALNHVRLLSEAFRHVASKVKPSVVSIEVVRVRRPGEGNPWIETPNRSGLGSGVIVSSDGYILTNHHVVEHAKGGRVTVALSNGHKEIGRMIGTDVETDLALIKMPATDLTPIEFGDSDAIQVGDWVVAVGAPFNLRQTVTAGIISAKNRITNILRHGYEDYIQTDAAINPGNSGGPLVDMNGGLVGINNHITTSTRGYQGVGMAIPSNMAEFVMDRLKKEGKVVRGYLGVYLENLTPGLARSYGFESTAGVLATEIEKGSPADKHGIEVDDIMVALNDVDLNNLSELRGRVAMLRPNAEASLKIWRDGRMIDLTVRIGEKPAKYDLRSDEPTEDRQLMEALGVKLGSLSEADAEQFGLRGGAEIESVSPISYAQIARVAPGDIIIEVQDMPISSDQEAEQAIKKYFETGVDGVRIRIFRPPGRGRQGGPLVVYLRFPSD
jgi:serine protease Do